jgi:WD40 repeat protein
VALTSSSSSVLQEALWTRLLGAALSYIGALTFSSDGQSLAAGFDDTAVLIWDVSQFR